MLSISEHISDGLERLLSLIQWEGKNGLRKGIKTRNTQKNNLIYEQEAILEKFSQSQDTASNTARVSKTAREEQQV